MPGCRRHTTRLLLAPRWRGRRWSGVPLSVRALHPGAQRDGCLRGRVSPGAWRCRAVGRCSRCDSHSVKCRMGLGQRLLPTCNSGTIPPPTTCGDKEAWDVCPGWEPTEAGVRTPGGLDPRPPPWPTTAQTALPQSPRSGGDPGGQRRSGNKGRAARYQVVCVDAPDRPRPTIPDHPRPSPTHSSRPRSSPVGSGDPMRCAGPAGGGAEGDAPGAAGEGGLEERDGANLQPSQPY